MIENTFYDDEGFFSIIPIYDNGELKYDYEDLEADLFL